MEGFLHANLVNSNVVRAVRRRGNFNDGRNYGPRYVNANNAPSNGNWNYGSGLTLCPVNTIAKSLNVYCFSKVLETESKYHPTGIGLVGLIKMSLESACFRYAGVREPKG